MKGTEVKVFATRVNEWEILERGTRELSLEVGCIRKYINAEFHHKTCFRVQINVAFLRGVYRMNDTSDSAQCLCNTLFYLKL